MFLHITQATHLENYKIAVTFNDGKEGVADLSELLEGPVFEPLKDIAEFARFRVDEELETIVWPNVSIGGADLAPERVYFEAFRDKDDPALQARFREWGYTA